MFGFVGRWRPLLYCVFAFYESNLTYVTVPSQSKLILKNIFEKGQGNTFF